MAGGIGHSRKTKRSYIMKTDSARVYQIRRLVDSGGTQPRSKEWRNNADEAAIDNFPWAALASPDYRPATSARVANDAESLSVFMETDETELRAEARGFGYVHTDSCMEFFLSPDPASSSDYLNWEFNPAGAMYLSIGKNRHERAIISDKNYPELFQLKTATHSKGWNLEYRIPLSFLRRFFPLLELRPGHTMRGNFYKCGEKTARPHFGCWSPIDLPQPDFHCPDFFGTLICS